MTPMYVIRDPELFRHLSTKEFDSFEDHKFLIDREIDNLFGQSVFLMRGQKWREMRATLSPAFTGSKMRLMFELVRSCADNAMRYLHKIDADKEAKAVLPLEMGEVFSRYANDVIATCAFGVELDSFADRNNEFYLNGKKITDVSFKVVIKFLAQRIAPGIMKLLKIQYFDSDLKTFFATMIERNMKTRREHSIVRPDMVDLLMKAKAGAFSQQDESDSMQTDDGFATTTESSIGRAKVTRQWTDGELIAQTFVFFLAGFDTTTALLVAASYEIMLNAEVQQKLISEIDECEIGLNGAKISYERLQKLTYLDMVISEALRIRPPAAWFDRLCSKDFELKIDGRTIEIKKGQQIWVPVAAYHHDPNFFPNPEKFDPERFSEENRSSINPAWYIPFGVGPRNCIGSRMALMVAKTVLYYLLRNYTLEPNSKTQIPMKMVSVPTGMYPEKGLCMNLRCRRAPQ